MYLQFLCTGSIFLLPESTSNLEGIRSIDLKHVEHYVEVSPSHTTENLTRWRNGYTREGGESERPGGFAQVIVPRRQLRPAFPRLVMVGEPKKTKQKSTTVRPPAGGVPWPAGWAAMARGSATTVYWGKPVYWPPISTVHIALAARASPQPCFRMFCARVERKRLHPEIRAVVS